MSKLRFENEQMPVPIKIDKTQIYLNCNKSLQILHGVLVLMAGMFHEMQIINFGSFPWCMHAFTFFEDH